MKEAWTNWKMREIYRGLWEGFLWGELMQQIQATIMQAAVAMTAWFTPRITFILENKFQIRDSLTVAWCGWPSSWSRVCYSCLVGETETAPAPSGQGSEGWPDLAPAAEHAVQVATTWWCVVSCSVRWTQTREAARARGGAPRSGAGGRIGELRAAGAPGHHA